VGCGHQRIANLRDFVGHRMTSGGPIAAPRPEIALRWRPAPAARFDHCPQPQPVPLSDVALSNRVVSPLNVALANEVCSPLKVASVNEMCSPLNVASSRS
jgi:hypothetical protein